MKLQGFAVAGKSWVAFGGSLLAVLIPWLVTNVVPTLPEPYPALIGAVLALATAVGVYHAPYAPVAGQEDASQPTAGGTPWPTA